MEKLSDKKWHTVKIAKCPKKTGSWEVWHDGKLVHKETLENRGGNMKVPKNSCCVKEMLIGFWYIFKMVSRFFRGKW